jgi:hypothetical protein
MLTSRGPAVGLIVLIGAGYLGTLRAGHEWGDDFCLYLRHARNLAEGADYADTGYVYNPAFPSLSPRTYPPLLPLLLAPVYGLFGLNLEAMKAEMVLLFVAFLGVAYARFRDELPRGARLALVAFLAFNPYLWDYKDRILSEIPFLLFAYLALHFIDRSFRPDRVRTRRLPDALLAGLCVYLASATRSVGIVLVPCLVLEGLWRERRLFNPLSLASLAVFAAGVLVQRALLPVDASYLDQLAFDPAQFARNSISLAKAMGLFAANGYSDALRNGLFAVLSAFALAGFARRLRTGPGVHECFAVLYTSAIVVWPSSEWNQRFLLPLLPLYAAYVLHGIGAAAAVCPRTVALPAGIGLAAAVLASYAGQYTRMEFGSLREGVGKAETVALFDYVRSHTAGDDVFVFQKPRALALFTGRRASALHTPASDEELWAYLDRVRAGYVIVSPLFADNYRLLRPFVERNADRLREVYENRDFAVYRLGTGPAARACLGERPREETTP